MRRTTLKVLAALTVFGGVFAMAASLGGISSAKLGADDTVVASCDTDGVTTSYTSAWDATDKRYETTTVAVGGVAAACVGQTMKVTLVDSTGAALGEGTASLTPAGPTTVTPTSPPASKSVVGVHVTIA
jgi:hypothetical protein